MEAESGDDLVQRKYKNMKRIIWRVRVKADKEVFARFSLSHLNETVGRVEFELR